MRNIYRSLLLVIACATQKELARQVRYLKVENQIFRGKLPARIPITPKERHRLARFAAKLRKALDCLATIAHPDTIRRWIREERKAKRRKTKPVGRRRTKEEIRALILLLAKENDGWGYTRIMGEMKKLGIKPPSRNTVKRILRENGFDPSPKRRENTWDEFLKLHAETLWQCDFLSVKSLTAKGIQQLFVLVFIHVGSRRLYVAPSTANPDAAWVRRQASAFLAQLPTEQRDKLYLQHDRDSKFCAAFDDTIKAAGGKILKSPYRSPNLTAYVERVIQTLRVEALDHFVLFGQKHLDYILAVFTAFYNEHRPHQSKENRPLPDADSQPEESSLVESVPLSQVRCQNQLGGLLKHYYRKAA